MTVTSSLFEAHLKCSTKCWLRVNREPTTGNTYAEWVKTETDSFRAAASERLLAQTPLGECVLSPPIENLKAAKWLVAVDVAVAASDFHRSSRREEAHSSAAQPSTINSPPADQSLVTSAPTDQAGASPTTFTVETRLHAIERVPSEGRGKAAQFIPIRFVFFNKLTKDDKLLLAFDAFVLSAALGREIAVGKIIHGEDRSRARESAADFQDQAAGPQVGAITAALSRAQLQPQVTKVKTSVLAGEVRKRLEKITALLSSSAPPDLVLNRHCAECEFRDRCRRIAVEKDDLSLLAGMSAKERQKLRSKGIFTVTQLSYTFRPRRRPKRLRDKREKYHHSLKALAIREKKIHIVGSPELKIDGTPVYLDVEGLPNRDFYYLIGLRIGHGESAVQHRLWADTIEDEGKIWREFLGILETVEKPVLIHYGSYETTFLTRMRERYGEPPKGSVTTTPINSPINFVSLLFAQVYFPTLSNTLKHVGAWLGCKWSSTGSSGTDSIIWRMEWEELRDAALKEKLITYNSEDCCALERLSEAIVRISSDHRASLADGTNPEVAIADEPLSSDTLLRRFSSPIADFESINKAARWDFQRDRIYVRTDKLLKRTASERRARLNREKARLKKTFRINKSVDCEELKACPFCGRKPDRQFRPRKLILYDLHFSKFGIKRWVVQFRFHYYWCGSCNKRFGTPKEFWPKSDYGRNVVILVIYDLIELCMRQYTTKDSLDRLFGLGIGYSTVHQIKSKAAEVYAETRQRILSHLIKGKLIHADETPIALKDRRGYVWVFAGLHEVVYFYADTREGDLLRDKLKDFKGVLVSDFYTAYDSLSCSKQKCLLHLMRDLNQAVLDFPFDEELKQVALQFGDLLRRIVETIDRWGLKRRFLKKHLLDVDCFYRKIAKAAYHSETALKFKERFEKNRQELFTFLTCDGVPWNNNNAEHAIKAFARLRRAIVGESTPKGIEDYLILFSVCQTCKYMGVDFLDFLRSGETDIHAFAESRRGHRRRRRSAASGPKALPADASAGPQP